MISLSSFALGAVLYAVPCEYVIDFGAEAAPFAYEMFLTFEARDGTRDEYMIDWGAKADPKGNRDELAFILRDGWVTRPGPGNSLVVVGMATGNKSPIKSVTLKSDKLIPVTVRWVPLVPEKKK